VTAQEFIKKVQDECDCDSEENAREGIEIVLGLLSHSLPEKERMDIVESLPEDLKNLWDSDPENLDLHHSESQNSWFSSLENELRNRDLSVNPLLLSKVVLTTLKDTLSQSNTSSIRNTLPDQLSDMWNSI
jgi:uncharacterized protein (DUF2267 family)